MTNQTIDGVPRDPCQWTDLQILDFLGVALRNVDLVGTVKLSEIRQGFEYMRNKQQAAQPQGDTVPVSAHWSDWSMVTLEIDGRHRTYVECGKPERTQNEPETPACKTPGGLECPGDGVGQCKKCPAARPQGEPLIHITPEVLAQLRGERKMQPGGLTFSESKPLGNWTVPLYTEQPASVAGLEKRYERLKERAWAVMQEAMEGAHVHPCDEHSEDAKVRTLAPMHQALYASLKATGEQFAPVAAEIIPAPRALLERIETRIPEHCQDLTDLQTLLNAPSDNQVSL